MLGAQQLCDVRGKPWQERWYVRTWWTIVRIVGGSTTSMRPDHVCRWCGDCFRARHVQLSHVASSSRSHLGGCAQSSPLSQIEQYLQVEIEANPGNLAGRPPFTLSIETWNHLAVLGDAVDAGEITATLDERPLVIDPSGTGYFQNRDYYRARFGLPETRSATIHPPGISTITITDGETSWSGEIADLFTNDLAAQGPITPGQNELVWPSATAPSPYTNIDWACVEVGVQASACGGDSVFEADGVRVVLDRDLAAVHHRKHRRRARHARRDHRGPSGGSPELRRSGLPRADLRSARHHHRST